jgi:hypothetical protein
MVQPVLIRCASSIELAQQEHLHPATQLRAGVSKLMASEGI